jgi:hypothetical protein
MRTGTVTAAILALAITATVRGQTRQAQVDEIRHQIDALQRKLGNLESAQASPAQKVTQLGASRHQRGEPTLIVRVYDLSDLFAIAPAYAAAIGNDIGLSPRALFPEAAVAHSGGGTPAGAMGGMGGMGMFAIANEPLLAQAGGGRGAGGQAASADVAASAKTSIQALINAITSTIDPDSWEELSGPGSIARIGTSLIIRNDAGVHDQIDALFTLLRHKWGTLRTVSVTAWWLPVADAQLAKLLPGNGKGKTGVEEIEAYGIVDEAAWKEFIAVEAPADRKGTAADRAVITCYNGQTVSATSGGEEGIVNDIEPILTHGTNDEPVGRVAYRPTITPIQEGTSLQITPLVSSSGKFVMLDVHSRVAIREAAPAARRQAARDDDQGPAAIVGALDRPRLVTQRLATTLRAPFDRVMLVGGMTFAAMPQGKDPPLYLFLRATVQELKDDARKAEAVEPVVPEKEKLPEGENEAAR